MTHAGIVSEVFGANVPDTNRPAQKVIVNVVKSDAQPEGKEPTLEPFQPQVAFYIAVGASPAEGEAISCGPGYAWWVGEKVDKLSPEMAP